MSSLINPGVEVKNEPEYTGPKYHEDGPFRDPMVRCYNCGEMHLTQTWRQKGRCTKCQNRRCRNVLEMTPLEMVQAQEWKVDPEFLALFERVYDEGEK